MTTTAQATAVRVRQPATSGRRLWTVRVNGVVDGVDHAVTGEDMSAGMAAGQGIFRAVCGVAVTSDALAAPPGRLCSACWVTLHPPVHTQGAVVPVARHGHRRPGRLRWWVASAAARYRATALPGEVVREVARGWVR